MMLDEVKASPKGSIHPEDTIHVCAKFHSNLKPSLSYSCWDILVYTKVGDLPANQITGVVVLGNTF